MNIAHGPLRQINHFRDIAHMPVQDGGIGGFKCHIGSTTHGNAHIGCGKGWCIIDAIAHFGNDPSFLAQFADNALLVLRQKLGAHFDAKITPDGFRCAAVVAGQHQGGDAAVLQLFQASDSVSARLVAHGDGASNPAIGNQHGNSLALIIAGGNTAGQRIGDRRNIIRSLARTEKKYALARDARHTLAAMRLALRDFRQFQRPLFSSTDNCKRKRMAGTGIKGSGKPQNLVFRQRVCQNVRHLGLAFGKCAGFVEAGRGDFADGFQNPAAFHEKAAPRTGRKGRSNGSRRGNDQRTRATDQQNGKPLIDPLVPDAARKKGRQDRDQRRHNHNTRRIIGRETIDETLGRGLGLLCLLHQTDDAGDGIVLSRRGYFHAQKPVTIDRARENHITFALANRRAFTGHGRFIDGAFA